LLFLSRSFFELVAGSFFKPNTIFHNLTSFVKVTVAPMLRKKLEDWWILAYRGPRNLLSGTVTSYFHHFWQFLFLFLIFLLHGWTTYWRYIYINELAWQKVNNSAPFF